MKSFSYNNFSENIFQIHFIDLSRRDKNFFPTLLHKEVWKVLIFIILLFSILFKYATHFNCCCKTRLINAISVIWQRSLLVILQLDQRKYNEGLLSLKKKKKTKELIRLKLFFVIFLRKRVCIQVTVQTFQNELDAKQDIQDLTRFFKIMIPVFSLYVGFVIYYNGQKYPWRNLSPVQFNLL